MYLGNVCVFDQNCELIEGNKLENDSDTQYTTCLACYRFDICRNWYLRKKKKLLSQLVEEVNIHE